MQMARVSDAPIRCKAARSTCVLFMSIGAVPAGFGLFGVRSPGGPAFLALGLAVMGWAFVWLKTLEVVLTNETISYRTLHRGTRVLRLADIEKSGVEIGATELGWRSRPMIRLALYPKDSRAMPLDINLKMLNQDDAEALLAHLGLKTRAD